MNLYPLVGDASSRNYYRVSNLGKSYIVMDLPDRAGDLAKFIQIAELLQYSGLRAPAIEQADLLNGFLLLEDFGQLTLRQYYLNLDADKRYQLYCSILDLVVKLQTITPPANLEIVTTEKLVQDLEPFYQYFIPYHTKNQKIDQISRQEIDILRASIASLINQHEFIGQVFTLRDFHAENMMYLPQESALNRYGLLDFQDALTSYRLYDVVSLLQDARLKIESDFALACVRYYAKKTNLPFSEVKIDFNLLGLQRNLRILGLFAKKFLYDQNNHYLQYVDITLDYVRYNLEQIQNMELTKWFAKAKLM